MGLPHLHFTSLTPRELCGDIVESYRLAAERLGYPTSYADCTFQPGVINVLFFFWDVPWEMIAPYHPDCIVVNFEPMVPGTHAWRDNYLGVLKQCYLWEYSQSNFQRNRALELRVADYVPLAYEEGAAPVLPPGDVLPDVEQDIDVVFFGSMTQRRVDVLHALMARGVRLAVTNGRQWSIEERDAYLRRAKLALNFHNWEDSRVVEIGRLSILFRQRKAVVCELYPDSEIEPALRDVVAGAPYEALVDTVLALLADAPRRAALERAGLPALARLSQTEWVGPALDRYRQWRSQQNIMPDVTMTVAVCVHIEQWDDVWADTLRPLAQESELSLVVATVCAEATEEVKTALDRLGLQAACLLPMPAGIDLATARNWALRHARADAIAFCDRGEQAAPRRLARLGAFLASQPTIDVVTHWLLPPPDSASQSALRVAELDHEIKADLLGPQPLRLSHCIIRHRFLVDRGVMHDPELSHHSDLHFLCKCAAAGARFAALPEALLRPGPVPSAPVADAPETLARWAVQVRRPWVQAVFPHLTHAQVALMCELYVPLWAPDAHFARRLLGVLAEACLHSPDALGSEQETLARVLRREAVRLLTVFAQSNLIDHAWLDDRFANEEVARFLAPVSADLPWRPSHLQPVFNNNIPGTAS